MRAEIVAVGTELLLGQIANTNARWMSERLAAIGVDVLHHDAVGDNLDRIVETLRSAVDRSDAVIVTGGLGPTQADITRDAIAVLLGVGMVRHPEIEELLREKFRACVTSPICRTVSGRRVCAWLTRFCVCTCAVSRSVPRRNVTVIEKAPSGVADEFM